MALFHYFFCEAVSKNCLLADSSTWKFYDQKSFMNAFAGTFPQTFQLSQFFADLFEMWKLLKSELQISLWQFFDNFLGQFIWVLKVLKVGGLTWSHKIFYSKGTYTKTIKTVVFYDPSLKDAFCFFLARVTFELSLCITFTIALVIIVVVILNKRWQNDRALLLFPQITSISPASGFW